MVTIVEEQHRGLLKYPNLMQNSNECLGTLGGCVTLWTEQFSHMEWQGLLVSASASGLRDLIQDAAGQC